MGNADYIFFSQSTIFQKLSGTKSLAINIFVLSSHITKSIPSLILVLRYLHELRPRDIFYFIKTWPTSPYTGALVINTQQHYLMMYCFGKFF